jgi:hypothetical protein
MTQVALSTDFLKAFALLPRPQQKKVRAFVEKFKADPTQGSIHYEPIHDMADDKVRTVRIDQAYRAVVLHPPHGDVYLCVWVDHHDEAMEWARRKRFDIHPHTGSLQVWQSEDVQGRTAEQAVLAQPIEVPVASDRLFATYPDDDLLLIGVPQALLPAVRAVRIEADLDSLSGYLPEEARDGLYMLAAGYSLEEAVEALVPEKPAADTPIDTQDFQQALARPGSERQFKLVEDDAELAEMLDAPLAQWRVFLHPSQRTIVKMNSAGSARVLGGAGTGKTVVAMHRARHLAKQLPADSTAKILFTTFTRNLAADISGQLDVLCGAERDRIEVVNLHAWATRLLKARGVSFVPVGDDSERDRLWDNAMAAGSVDLPQGFFEREWDEVVLSQDITEENEYLRARRVGRGTPLGRAQRKQVWKVFAAYRAQLDESGKMEMADTVREARLALQQEGSHPYAHVVADEVQDLTLSDLRLLRQLVAPGPNDIFVVGDAHQRIYLRRGSLGEAGISVRGRQSRRLKINYRTTDAICRWSLALLEGIDVDDMDDGKDDSRGYRSLRTGPKPELVQHDTADAERESLCDWVEARLAEGVPSQSIAVVARTARLYKGCLEALTARGITTREVNTEADSVERDGVRLATMHRVKGLEFPCVAIVAVNQGDMPLRYRKSFADEAAKVAYEETERRLLYVAATRARDRLRMSCGGKPSPIVRW